MVFVCSSNTISSLELRGLNLFQDDIAPAYEVSSMKTWFIKAGMIESTATLPNITESFIRRSELVITANVD